MELLNENSESKNLTELEKELRRFFIPIVVSMFRQKILEINFNIDKKEIFIKSDYFSFKIDSSAKIKNLKGNLSSIEKENLKKIQKEYKEILDNHL